jgi:hypothetical protein
MDVKAALKHPGQIIFNAEYDTHYPSLTVAETLKFALKMKTPANRPNGISQKEYEDGQSASGSPQSVSILFVQRADDHVVRLIQNTWGGTLVMFIARYLVGVRKRRKARLGL